MRKYKCVICGYIYDENLGDPISGIRENTLFEDIDNDWLCPLCGADKNEFESLDN